MKSKAALYARFSSNNQRDESIDAQLRAIYSYAECNNIDIVNEYIDRAKTGTNSDRDSFQAMLSDSKKGDFDSVIVHKLDRFARNRYDSAISRKQLRDNGVSVISVLERFDDSPESIILEGLLESMNEYYSANLSREVRKGMKENAISCKYTGGYVPLGFKINSDKQYEINEEEARIVRFIFDSVFKGNSYTEIIKELANRGYKTRTGQVFGKNALYSILTNEKYTGVYVYNKRVEKDSSGKRNSHKFKPSGEVIRVDNGVPLIIDKEKFDTVQAILEKRKHNKTSRSDSKETYLLTGKIYCGECGGKYCGNRQYSGRNKRLYLCYRCNVRARKTDLACNNKEVSRDKIESYVLKILADILFDKSRIPNVIKEYNKTVNENVNTKDIEVKSLNKTVHKLETEINNIVSIMANTGSVALVTALNQKEQDLSALKRQIEQLKRQNTNIEIDEKAIINAFDNSRSLLIKGELPQLKQLISLYVERVDIYKDSINVKLNILQALKSNSDSMKLTELNKTFDDALSIETSVNRIEIN